MGPIASPNESRVVLRNVRWQTYEALLEDRGEKPIPRFFFDRGTLEIVAISGKHERLKCLIRRFSEIFTLELGIEIRGTGSTTFKSWLLEKGLEADESYYIQNEAKVRAKDDLDLSVDPPPDLAIEIDITRTGVDKLGIYAALGIPEVWSHDGSKVVIYSLKKTGEHEVVPRSRALPMFPLDEIGQFLDLRNFHSDTQILEAFQAWIRQRKGSGPTP